MVEELRQDNKIYRLFERFHLESKAVTIASVALVITVLALLMAFMALDDAKDARMRAEYQDKKIEELVAEVRIYSNRSIRLESWLKSKGVPLEEINDLGND